MKKPKIFEKLSKKQAVIISAVLFVLGVVCYIFSFRNNNILGVLTLDRISGALMIAGLLLFAGIWGGAEHKASELNDKYEKMLAEMREKTAELNEQTYGDEDEGKEEISITSEKLGKFIYRRKPQWYEAECGWCGQNIFVRFDVPKNLPVSARLRQVEKFFDTKAATDKEVRRIIAGKEELLTHGEFLDDYDVDSVTFAERIVPVSVAFKSSENCSYELSYDDECGLWVLVSGTLSEGISGIEILD